MCAQCSPYIHESTFYFMCNHATFFIPLQFETFPNSIKPRQLTASAVSRVFLLTFKFREQRTSGILCTHFPHFERRKSEEASDVTIIVIVFIFIIFILIIFVLIVLPLRVYFYPNNFIPFFHRTQLWIMTPMRFPQREEALVDQKQSCTMWSEWSSQ